MLISPSLFCWLTLRLAPIVATPYFTSDEKAVTHVHIHEFIQFWYKIGQLYMISKHSNEQSGGGEGVEVVRNQPDTHPQHGLGQLTEKRIYLNSKLPSWVSVFVPRVFYVTEKAWNFYPYTITEYSVSFLPKFSIRIETRFENNNGDNNNVFGDRPTPAESVSHLDILIDPIPDKHYKETEDLSRWVSEKTGRGPLVEGWRKDSTPIMCSYKRVQCSFEVYGFQGKTEDFIHRNIQDILLVGHRQAVAWTDEWHGMSLEDVREYERQIQEQTNSKLKSTQNNNTAPRPAYSRSMSVTDERSLKKMGVKTMAMSDPSTSTLPHSTVRLNSTPE
ncbi:cytoplasmic phosphatidylinositol transfer protein 1 isoform X2 [Oncorhynchus kisutch]|uniref:cytoplasmic phosphatidylinositol transfer protein 1 isoform X2 n=1 Tax=Oncorhynchus kisutch TaxID=8019 RepID=UPI0012DD0277|nr:cytoplasmic phosphatidylinositol transfer protein 1-like isoform X2 [Oncorhynchus kisutch]